MANEDDNIGRMIISSRRGCVVAAAGCGKTEQIARATAISDCRRLILTHTHAGVDAILHRLRKHRVSSSKFQINTIAAWCLQFCSSYPKRAGFDNSIPPKQTNWHEVYEACLRLLQSGAVDGIIRASYGGILVDEYQDCSKRQHEVIRLLAENLPCIVFGDSLQGIFDFSDDPIVDWETEVYPVFPQKAELKEPYRWINARNPELAEWLKFVRTELEQHKQVDLSTRPLCVRYVSLPQVPEERSKVIQRTCLESLKFPRDQNIIVLDNAAVPESRARLARNLARERFHNIEALDCKPLAEAAERIDANTGSERLNALLDFAGECMTGTDKAALARAIQSHMSGRKQGQKAFHVELPLARRVIENGTSESMLTFLDAIYARTNTILYRREMFSAMQEALRMISGDPNRTLSEGVWVVQNRIRHIGRRFGRSNVGSVLLVKGLEFDHAIIVHQSTMTNKDWYVALTRATKCIRILAPFETIVPFVRRRVDPEPSQQSFDFHK